MDASTNPDYPPSTSATVTDEESYDRADVSMDGGPIETYELSHREHRFMGALFFKLEIAQQVVSGAMHDEDRDIVKLCRQRLEDYPYSRAYSMLQAKFVDVLGPHFKQTCCSSDRGAFLTGISIINIADKTYDRTLLDGILTEFRNVTDTENGSDTAASSRIDVTDSASTVTGQGSARQTLDSSDRLPLYRMKLNDLEQEDGQEVNFSKPINLALDPPVWQTSMWYNNEKFTRRAKQVKTAQQLICQDVCHRFGYRV